MVVPGASSVPREMTGFTTKLWYMTKTMTSTKARIISLSIPPCSLSPQDPLDGSADEMGNGNNIAISITVPTINRTIVGRCSGYVFQIMSVNSNDAGIFFY